MAALQRVHAVTETRAQRGEVGQHPRHAQLVWLNASGALGYLGLKSRSGLNYHIAENGLPFHRLGNRLRFHVGELDAWLLASGSMSVRHVQQSARMAGPRATCERQG